MSIVSLSNLRCKKTQSSSSKWDSFSTKLGQIQSGNAGCPTTATRSPAEMIDISSNQLMSIFKSTALHSPDIPPKPHSETPCDPCSTPTTTANKQEFGNPGKRMMKSGLPPQVMTWTYTSRRIKRKWFPKLFSTWPPAQKTRQLVSVKLSPKWKLDDSTRQTSAQNGHSALLEKFKTGILLEIWTKHSPHESTILSKMLTYWDIRDYMQKLSWTQYHRKKYPASFKTFSVSAPRYAECLKVNTTLRRSAINTILTLQKRVLVIKFKITSMRLSA